MKPRRTVSAAIVVGCVALLSCGGTKTASTTTSTTTSTVAATTTSTIPKYLSERVFGTSVQGRELKAYERGDANGVRVVVIGSIHGDENAGRKIISALEDLHLPPGIDLWLVPTINPDGVALKQRGNANQVDLNRNFPYNWGTIAQKGEWEWSGPSAASEPETRATVSFLTEINPALVLWYHQDLFCISPSEGLDGEIRQMYSDLTGIPLKKITGGTYTGVAATWQRNTVAGSIGFVVELGPTLTRPDAHRYASAVLQVATRLQ